MTIGLDLGDRQGAQCVVDAAGVVVARALVTMTVAGLRRAFAAYPGAQVVLEVGTQSPWVSRWLTQQGHAVLIANPWRVRRIAGMTNKSDRIDAELLARLGRADPALLRPIHHRSEAVQRDRALLRVRDQLVRARAGLVTQARGIAKALGTRLPRCDAQRFPQHMDRAQLRESFPGFGALLDTVTALSQQIAALDAAITRVARERYPATAQLQQVRGVGPITALAYVLTIEDPRRFAHSRDVGAYLGLRPKRYQSGASDPALGISKAGDPFLRRTLVQAAHYILGHYGPDTTLRRFGERLMDRGGRAARQRAAVAVARKLAVLLHRLWTTGAAYDPERGLATARAV
jgi:transposase